MKILYILLTVQSFNINEIAMGMYFRSSSPRQIIIRWIYCRTPECTNSFCATTSNPRKNTGSGYTHLLVINTAVTSTWLIPQCNNLSTHFVSSADGLCILCWCDCITNHIITIIIVEFLCKHTLEVRTPLTRIKTHPSGFLSGGRGICPPPPWRFLGCTHGNT